MKILVKGNIIASEGIGSTIKGAIRTVADFDEKDYDVIIDGNIDVKSILVASENVEVYVTGYMAAGVSPKQIVYIVRENYSCEEENACGDCYDVERKDIVGVCKSKEVASELVGMAVDRNNEEYYKVDARDYEVLEAVLFDTAEECYENCERARFETKG